ncbi:MAG: hypothetical protein ABH879_00410 [archaeon]
MPKYLFESVAASIVFDQNKLLTLTAREAKNFGKLETATDTQVRSALSGLKDSSHYPRFRERNLQITRRLIHESVKPDSYVIQAANNIDDIDRAINMLSKRLREWYSLYFPEFSRTIESHVKFAELISKSRNELMKELGCTGTMGGDADSADLAAMRNLAGSIVAQNRLRESHEAYLDTVMGGLCPNLKALVGVLIGAKLIALAGSIEKLVKLPASTIQLLGAEKALFRHIKTGARCPRHGIIMQHPLISSAAQKEHGKRSRVLADKIAIAVKIDYYKGEFAGERMRRELEARFR